MTTPHFCGRQSSVMVGVQGKLPSLPLLISLVPPLVSHVTAGAVPYQLRHLSLTHDTRGLSVCLSVAKLQSNLV